MLRLFRFLPLTVVLLAGCSTLSISLPPVTETPAEQRLAGKIIWHDLLTADIDASRTFYAGLFGWEFREVPLSLGIGRSGRYLVIYNQGRPIGGMVDTARARDRINNSQWVAVMSVDDVDAATAQVRRAGGAVLTPPTDLNERGRIAVVRDSGGALFAILETRAGDPPDSPANYGDFLWDEVWTDDVAKAATFYQALAPFEPVSEVTGTSVYQGLAVDGVPRFGLLQEPLEGLDPTWAPYVRVRDMSLLERVESLGGRVVIPAVPRALGGEAALITGPSGAGIALHTWEKE